MAKQLYLAEWVLPITSAPLRHAAVMVEDDRIAFVGPRVDVETQAAFADVERRDFGRAALLPGFVNTHSHLELTLMRGFLEDLAFRDWIIKLTTTKYERLTADDMQASALLGAAEAIRAGITTLADTGDTRAAFSALLASKLRGVAYRECFGPDPQVAEQSVAELAAKIGEMREHETQLVRVGISPHAPYTVSARLFQLASEYARRESLDLCIHTAESQAEQEMLLAGAGEFAEGLRRRGINWQAPGVSTVKYFERLGVLEAAPLLVHCVRADDEEVALLAQRRARVAHCPKSNAKLGHGIAPLAAMIDAGVAVGLGTDSVASNNRCDLIDEARFAVLIHRGAAKDYRGLSADEALRLATIGGAQALRLDDRIGSLEVGKQADLIAIDLAATHNTPAHDPAAAIVFAAAASDVCYTIVAGRVLFDGRELKTVDEGALQARVNAALPRMQSPAG
jgi:cytosine/adenosine deaminase-related metal-dependent hydrolase